MIEGRAVKFTCHTMKIARMIALVAESQSRMSIPVWPLSDGTGARWRMPVP